MSCIGLERLELEENSRKHNDFYSDFLLFPTLSLMMKLFNYHFGLIASFVLGSTISMLNLVPEAKAGALKLQNFGPIVNNNRENSTCYIQLLGRNTQTLDHLCGTHEPKSDRRRGRNELDTDGLPFLMKENYKATEEAHRKLQEAQERLERELPLSDNAVQLKAQQQRLWEQLKSAKTQPERDNLFKQSQELAAKLETDPSVKKAYEMMRKLYQSNSRR